MQNKRIIPCLDMKNGRVVKGVHFVDFKDAGDPVEAAVFYSNSLADELVFLDIAATAENRGTMLDVVTRTAERVTIPFTVGGGIRSLEDIKKILDAGADKVSINSAAVKNPSLIEEATQMYGKRCIVAAIDAKEREGGGYDVYLNGGQVNAGIDAVEFAIEAEKRGACEILLTSMDRDGTKDGYDIPLTRTIAQAVNIPVIASGGAGSLSDFYDALTEGCADGALAASLFHFRTFSVEEVKQYLRSKNIPVRLEKTEKDEANQP